MEGVCQPWNVSSMAQAAGLAALQEREYVEKGRPGDLVQELAYLKEELAALQAIRFILLRRITCLSQLTAHLYEKLEQEEDPDPRFAVIIPGFPKDITGWRWRSGRKSAACQGVQRNR